MGDNTEEFHKSSCDSAENSNETSTTTTALVYPFLINKVQFYIHPQETISKTLIPSLYEHLPYSNPIFSRMLAPHNTPSRRCLFAATFPPFAQVPSLYTVVFSDRSRKTESQIWVFNPLITPFYSQPLSQDHTSLLASHLKSLLVFLKATVIPDAPGHPFDPILRFACLHEVITNCLTALLSSPSSLIPYHTRWNLYLIPTIPSLISGPLSKSIDDEKIEIKKSSVITSEYDDNQKGQVNSNIPSGIEQSSLPNDLPQSFTISRIPPEHIDLVVSTSSIPREPSTLLAQPSLCLLTPSSEMVAWAFIGIDGTREFDLLLYPKPPISPLHSLFRLLQRY